MSQRAGDTRTAREYDEHLKRIRSIVMDWQLGRIGTESKRAQVAAENLRYYQESTRGQTGKDITTEPRVVDEVVYRMAERMMMPVEAVGAAMAITRDASWKAANTDDPAEALRVQEQGREAYLDILRAAR